MNAIVPLSLMRPGETRVSWSDDAVETAKRLAAEGMSAGQIARIMSAEHPGITRNAVIGKLHRLGCAGGGHQANGDKPPGPRSVRCPALPRSRVGRERRGNWIEREAASAPSSQWVPIWELRDEVCHYPKGTPLEIEELRYCAAPVGDGARYCAHHHALCHEGPGYSKAKENERKWNLTA